MVKQILRVLDVAPPKQPVLFWGGSAGADLTEQDKLFVGVVVFITVWLS